MTVHKPREVPFDEERVVEIKSQGANHVLGVPLQKTAASYRSMVIPSCQ